jgi:hypothetical protein
VAEEILGSQWAVEGEIENPAVAQVTSDPIKDLGFAAGH